MTGFFRTAVVLGLISAIGPFAIDMYLPALPSIGASLGTNEASVQMSLTAFFAAMAVGQVIYGPLSDMLGRKTPLYGGLALFIAAGIGCALAGDIHTLIVLRFVQGLGACAGIVIPRAVVRDLHTGPDAARLMSLLMLVLSVSPILAPLTGSLIIDVASWRGVFWAVTLAALVGLLIVWLLLTETRPPEQRLESGVGRALATYGMLLTDRTFLGLSLIGSFGIASFFVYLANSSFIFIDHYGLTARQYSLAFSVNAVAFIGVAQANGILARRFGLSRIVSVATVAYFAVIATLFCLVLAGFDALPVIIAGLFVGFAFLGLIIPTTAVLALDAHGPVAGTASALLGTLQSVTGAVMIGLVGLFTNGTALPMVGGILACSLAALTLARLTLGQRRIVQPAE